MPKYTNFIGNADGTLTKRFNQLLGKTKCFDCLLDSFYMTGFHKIHEQLEDVDKIRIIIGSGINNEIFKPNEAYNESSNDEIHRNIRENLLNEVENSEYYVDFKDNNFKESVKLFIQWILSGKLEIRAYKTRIPSKLYIMSFDEKKSKGYVLTGSTNITSQIEDYSNLFFDLELKNSPDYSHASREFNEIWNESVDVKDDYINVISDNQWLNKEITPYKFYLKFLYEYLSDKIDAKLEDSTDNLTFPEGFKELQYQTDAVLQAKNIIEKHGGVFISDVVGLGKTYMGALLLKQLEGRSIVLAPRRLIDKSNPGGWYQVLASFNVTADVESSSTAAIKKVAKMGNLYQNVLIDESHEFRNKKSKGYKVLKELCKDKNVILVSATPFNNKEDDLQNQLNLFQDPKNSTLPGIKDLDGFFAGEKYKLNKAEKEDANIQNEVMREVNDNIRINVLEHVMVRRTREDIKKYYKSDLKKNEMKFPKINKPHKIYYEFDEKLNDIFDESLEIIANKLKFTRYSPLKVEYNPESKGRYQASQKNIVGMIKTQLIKRLESGIHAFKESIDRAIRTHELELKAYAQRDVFYTSKSYGSNILDLIEEENYDGIDKLIEKHGTNKIKKYKKSTFTNKFKEDLEYDLSQYKRIASLWANIEDESYPKDIKLIELLKTKLKDRKIILFTEFIATADFLEEKIRKEVGMNPLKITGTSQKKYYKEVIANFDGNVEDEYQKHDYDILITTDSLSHGMNLHRSNIIINYDIPWNPTRVMQRVGRSDRVGTKFEQIDVYNFFPATQIEDEIGLGGVASKKLGKFINLLGNDSQLLTEEPVKSWEVFDQMNAELKEEGTTNLSEELKYISELRDIKENDPELFDEIKNMPRKSVVAVGDEDTTELISLIGSDEDKKIIKSDIYGTKQISFEEAVSVLELKFNEETVQITKDYYEYLSRNKTKFNELSINNNSNFNGIKNEIIDVDKYEEQIDELQKNLNSELIEVKEQIISEPQKVETQKIESKVKVSSKNKEKTTKILLKPAEIRLNKKINLALKNRGRLDTFEIRYFELLKNLLGKGIKIENIEEISEKIKDVNDIHKLYNILFKELSPKEIKELNKKALEDTTDVDSTVNNELITKFDQILQHEDELDVYENKYFKTLKKLEEENLLSKYGFKNTISQKVEEINNPHELYGELLKILGFNSALDLAHNQEDNNYYKLDETGRRILLKINMALGRKEVLYDYEITYFEKFREALEKGLISENLEEIDKEIKGIRYGHSLYNYMSEVLSVEDLDKLLNSNTQENQSSTSINQTSTSKLKSIYQKGLLDKLDYILDDETKLYNYEKDYFESLRELLQHDLIDNYLNKIHEKSIGVKYSHKLYLELNKIITLDDINRLNTSSEVQTSKLKNNKELNKNLLIQISSILKDKDGLSDDEIKYFKILKKLLDAQLLNEHIGEISEKIGGINHPHKLYVELNKVLDLDSINNLEELEIQRRNLSKELSSTLNEALENENYTTGEENYIKQLKSVVDENLVTKSYFDKIESTKEKWTFEFNDQLFDQLNKVMDSDEVSEIVDEAEFSKKRHGRYIDKLLDKIEDSLEDVSDLDKIKVLYFNTFKEILEKDLLDDYLEEINEKTKNINDKQELFSELSSIVSLDTLNTLKLIEGSNIHYHKDSIILLNQINQALKNRNTLESKQIEYFEKFNNLVREDILPKKYFNKINNKINNAQNYDLYNELNTVIDLDTIKSSLKSLNQQNIRYKKYATSYEKYNNIILSKLSKALRNETLSQDEEKYFKDLKNLIEKDLLTSYLDKIYIKIKDVKDSRILYRTLVTVVSPDKIKDLEKYQKNQEIILSELRSYLENNELDTNEIEYFKYLKVLFEGGLLSEYADKIKEKIEDNPEKYKSNNPHHTLYYQLSSVIDINKLKELEISGIHNQKDSTTLLEVIEQALEDETNKRTEKSYFKDLKLGLEKGLLNGLIDEINKKIRNLEFDILYQQLNEIITPDTIKSLKESKLDIQDNHILQNTITNTLENTEKLEDKEIQYFKSLKKVLEDDLVEKSQLEKLNEKIQGVESHQIYKELIKILDLKSLESLDEALNKNNQIINHVITEAMKESFDDNADVILSEFIQEENNINSDKKLFKDKYNNLHLRGSVGELLQKKNEKKIDKKVSDNKTTLKNIVNESSSYKILDINSIKEKIEDQGTKIKDIKSIQVYRGIFSGCDTVFIVDEKRKNHLVQNNPKYYSILKPILKDKDVRRWKISFDEMYIIFTGRGINSVDIHEYPPIEKYLYQHKRDLMPKNKGDSRSKPGRIPGKYDWYEIFKPGTSYKKANEPRLILPSHHKELFAVYTEESYYVNWDYNILTCKDKSKLKIIEALLSSKVLNFIQGIIGTKVKSKFDLKPSIIEELPLIFPDEKEISDRIVELVDELHTVASSPNNSRRIAELENELNDIIYNLYGLTTDEIKIIESYLTTF